MSYSNDPNAPRREPINREETYYPDGSVDRREEIVHPNGSVDRRIYAEPRYDDPVVRDNENAARGMLVGIILASLLGLGLVLWYLATQRQPEPAQNIILPQQQTTPQQPTTPQQQPNVNITVPPTQTQPAPVQQAPPDVNVTPNVNITVPPAQQAPQPTPVAPQPQTVPVTPEGSAEVTPAPTAPEDTTTVPETSSP
jgi:hypothetical protein